MKRTWFHALPWLVCALMPFASLSGVQGWWPSLGLAAWLHTLERPFATSTLWWVAALGGVCLDALSGWPLGSHSVCWVLLWMLYQTNGWDVSHRTTQMSMVLLLLLGWHTLVMFTPWRDPMGLTSWDHCLLKALTTWLVYVVWLRGERG